MSIKIQIHVTYFERMCNSNAQFDFENTKKHNISNDGKENLLFAGDDKPSVKQILKIQIFQTIFLNENCGKLYIFQQHLSRT